AGHDEPGAGGSAVDWAALARFPGTLVVYMGVSRVASIADALIAGGLDPETPAALVSRGTLAGQRTIVAPISEIAGAVERSGVGAPGLIVVGRVVDQRSALAWFEGLPLFGQTIVITRPAGESDRSAEDL